MKKRAICFLLVCACLLTCLRAVAADGAGDSLISVSYLQTTLLPRLERQFLERAQEDTQELRQASLDRLAQVTSDAGETAVRWHYSETAQVHQLTRNAVITLSAGSTLLVTAGYVTAAAGLVDATAAADQAEGEKLAVRHRYINAAESETAVTVLSDAAELVVEGYWTLTEGDTDVTPFTDLVKSKDKWFYKPSAWAVQEGLIEGVSATRFDPTGTTSRGMLATLLYRMEGRPEVTYAGLFTDVSGKRWYAPGVEWAVSNDIVDGVTEDRFEPDSPISREMIACMLYRYAGNCLGLDVSQAGDLTARPDWHKVSDWAQEAMTWALGTGIITGSTGGKLLPGDHATRAEVVTMLQRFSKWLDTAQPA